MYVSFIILGKRFVASSFLIFPSQLAVSRDFDDNKVARKPWMANTGQSHMSILFTSIVSCYNVIKT